MALLSSACPLPAYTPSSKPALASQRDHSACVSLSPALVIRKCRTNVLDAPADIAPPCHGLHEHAHLPTRQPSVSRRVLQAVKAGLSRSNTSDKTLSNSTASTSELTTSHGNVLVHRLGGPDELDKDVTAVDRMLGKQSMNLWIPFIALEVVLDAGQVTMVQKQDIWVAIRATAASCCIGLDEGGATQVVDAQLTEDPACMALPSVRLMIQPAPRHRVLQTLGHKSGKNMRVGEHCELFVRLRVPRYEIPVQADTSELTTALTELESMLGTLKSEILHVEVRYKHPLIDASNSVYARQTVKIFRTHTELR